MRRILVTGGTGTLGAAIVAHLAAQNWRVTANFWRDENRALALQEKTGCELFRADVRDEKSVENLFAETQFEGVIHAAGANFDRLLLRQNRETWRANLEINLDAAFLVARASLRVLSHSGTLIFLASRVGESGFIGQNAYAAAKAGVLGLMKSAALEGRERRLTVCAICPGFAPGEMSERISPEILERRKAENWLLEADAGESVSALIEWILRVKPRINGQILRPDCRM